MSRIVGDLADQRVELGCDRQRNLPRDANAFVIELRGARRAVWARRGKGDGFAAHAGNLLCSFAIVRRERSQFLHADTILSRVRKPQHRLDQHAHRILVIAETLAGLVKIGRTIGETKVAHCELHAANCNFGPDCVARDLLLCKCASAGLADARIAGHLARNHGSNQEHAES
ncbi:hypothetical protein SAMN05216338_102796 [Bradyrhizobium sp. Rc2d]|nr:hypothetical protein SAMN05216338_102796 [Bradyrhizobium sp. Rc2d]